ncbi:MAG: MBL fold metallo-hydrolase [Negativicutes bacterium]|nr:MBL fold metallo-hydrolase [Negativicutes bacterium]
MKLHVLASGSTGNAVFLRCGGTKLLVDAGISPRRIKMSLASVGEAIDDIDGVLITHEHHDHVKGLLNLSKKYRLPVYTRPGTWQGLSCRDLIPEDCRRIAGDSFDIGEVKVEAFPLSHDANEPAGYNVYYRSRKLSIATDLGFVTDSVKKALACSDVMVFESNHDLDLLRQGSYPWYLKRRIMSNRGHLSNVDAGWTLARLDRKNHTQVFLAHLSQENNRPEIAEQTVRGILEEQGLAVGKDIELHLTYPDRIASLGHIFSEEE